MNPEIASSASLLWRASVFIFRVNTVIHLGCSAHMDAVHQYSGPHTSVKSALPLSHLPSPSKLLFITIIFFQGHNTVLVAYFGI